MRSEQGRTPVLKVSVKKACVELSAFSIMFLICSEYIAAWIALVIHPTNYEVICAWYHGAQSAENLTAEPELVPISDSITAQRLFAHVHQARLSMTNFQYIEFRNRLAQSVQTRLDDQQAKTEAS